MQVEGKDGVKVLMQKMKTNGLPVMYHGSMAAFAANLAGHYPWFAGKAIAHGGTTDCAVAEARGEA